MTKDNLYELMKKSQGVSLRIGAFITTKGSLKETTYQLKQDFYDTVDSVFEDYETFSNKKQDRNHESNMKSWLSSVEKYLIIVDHTTDMIKKTIRKGDDKFDIGLEEIRKINYWKETLFLIKQDIETFLGIY